jgi:hypothetical protein
MVLKYAFGSIENFLEILKQDLFVKILGVDGI